MNEQAEQALSQLLERAVSGVDQAVEFSQAQIPEVIEQLLMWHMVESLLMSVVGLALVIVNLYILKVCIPKVMNEFKKPTSDQNDYIILCSGGTMVLTTLLVTMSLGNIVDKAWLQILIAPKLYLLEYAAELVK